MIELTDHARERISTRLGAKPHKHQKLAEKAWRAPIAGVRVRHRIRFNHEMHEMMGWIWVFRVIPGKPITLLTVYSPKKRGPLKPDHAPHTMRNINGKPEYIPEIEQPE